jgi:hypothetical protein
MNGKNALVIAAAVAAVALTVACGAGSSKSGAGDSDSSKARGSGSPAKAATLGQAVRDGKFEFTVQKVKCGVSKVGTNLLGDRAQGQFCLVTLKAKNIGKEPQLFSDGNQKGFGADNVEFSPDSGAGIFVNGEQSTLLNEINPGNEVTGVIVFDIPKNAKLTRLELHDSALSGGVEVGIS